MRRLFIFWVAVLACTVVIGKSLHTAAIFHSLSGFVEYLTRTIFFTSKDGRNHVRLVKILRLFVNFCTPKYTFLKQKIGNSVLQGQFENFKAKGKSTTSLFQTGQSYSTERVGIRLNKIDILLVPIKMEISWKSIHRYL